MVANNGMQGQLLGEVSRFAQSPMDRFSKDLRSGQQAKVLAFEILGNMQGAAQSPRPRFGPMPFEERCKSLVANRLPFPSADVLCHAFQRC